MDMPLQHASRRLLARMKRGSSGDAFLRLLERMRETIPGVALRTSFIVGFPGETAADFRALCDFVRAAEFDWMGVFAYSDVESASSHALAKKISAEVAAERRDTLMSLQRPISAKRLRRFVGRRLPAMIEGPSRDTDLVWEGRLEGMAPEIDGKLYLTDIEPPTEDSGEVRGRRAALPGDIATVEITESHDYDLVGRVVALPEAGRVLTHRLPAGAAARNAHAAEPANPVRRISTGAPLRVLA